MYGTEVIEYMTIVFLLLPSSLLTHEKMLMDIEQILIFRYFVFAVKKKKNKLVWVGANSEDGLGSRV